MMRSRLAVLSAALLLSLIAVGATVGGALAHTPIISVSWDNPTNPTKLTAKTDGSPIDNRTGSFALKVIDASGRQVDLGNAVVSAAGNEISVSVMPNLAAGAYRVEWLTTGGDGEKDSGSLSITKAASAGQPAASAPAAQMGATATTITHSHDDSAADMGHADTTAVAAAMPSGPVTFEVRATGANQVPPVTSSVSAFARFRFDPATRQMRYDVSVSGASANLITAAHVHVGKAGTTGPHAYDIINAGFTQISGSWQMTDVDVNNLLAGNLYLNVHSVEHTSGAARAQLILPDSQPATHDHEHEATAHVVSQVTPPRTGDAGLLGHESSGLSIAGFAVLLVSVAASLGGIGYARRRA